MRIRIKKQSRLALSFKDTLCDSRFSVSNYSLVVLMNIKEIVN